MPAKVDITGQKFGRLTVLGDSSKRANSGKVLWHVKCECGLDLTVERKNVNGNYEPSNCKWGTDGEQANSKRNNRVVRFNGANRTLSQWADFLGVKKFTLYTRFNALGWSKEKALTTPPLTRK